MGIKSAFRDLVLRAKTVGVDTARRDMRGMRTEVKGLNTGWAKLGQVSRAALAGLTVAAAGATAATVASGKSLIDVGRQAETYHIQLKTVLRDSAQAKQLFTELVDFGQRTPFELPGLVDAAIRLETFGFNSINVLDELGDTAGAFGKDIETATLAFTQGVLGEMEMLKQFAITSADIEAELGHKINRQTKEGQREVAEALLSIFRERFAGGMNEMARSMNGMISNVLDNLFKVRLEIARGGFFDTIKSDLGVLLEWTNRFVERSLPGLSAGFNRGFQSIHDAFFAPLLGRIDASGGAFDTLGTRIELAMSLATLRVQKFVDFVDAIKLDNMREQLDQWIEDLIVDINAPSDGGAGGRGAKMWNFLSKIFGTDQATYDKVVAATNEQNQKFYALANELGAPDFVGPPKWLKTATDEYEAITKRIESLREQLATPFVGPPAWLANAPSVGTRDGADTGQSDAAETFREELEQTKAAAEESFSGLQSVAGGVLFAIREMQRDDVQQWIETERYRADFTTSQHRVIERSTQRMFDNMGRFQSVFVTRGMHIGRAFNAMLIRGATDVAKAAIDAQVEETRVRAKVEAAMALAAAARLNFGQAAQHAAAAIKFGAIGGLAGIATAALDQYAADREEALIGGGGFDGGGVGAFKGGASSGRARTGSAASVRVGNQNNVYNVVIHQNVNGDYVTSADNATDLALRIQELLQSGVLSVPTPTAA